MTDLKPCPFCGGQPQLAQSDTHGGIKCESCGATGPLTLTVFDIKHLGLSQSEADAFLTEKVFKSWNTRSAWQPIENRPKNEECLVWGGMWNGEINDSIPSGIAHVEGKLMVVGTDAYSAWITDPTYYCPMPDPPEEE